MDAQPGTLPATPPSEGKARIVFVETEERSGGAFFGQETTRFGVDGTWAGADKGDSWFAMEVTPGVHHLCVNWQGGKDAATGSLTVEAGKTYYYQVKITLKQVHSAYGTGGTMDKNFDFSPLSEDDGRYRVKASKLSTFKASK